MGASDILRLEPHGVDTYVGQGPQYPWGGLYGGQIVAQGLRAAAHTVEEQFRVHSLHAYFIRSGDPNEPIRFEVDRQRNGRSFVTRSVVARQAIGAILTMSVSFQVDEAGHDVQIAALPDVPGPDEVVTDVECWSPMFERRFTTPRAVVPGKATAWMRMAEPIGDDPILQACALAYLSDDLPTDAVVGLHPDVRSAEDDDTFHEGFMSASLDHAIWFHRPPVADVWHLHDHISHGYLSSRGLAIGHVLTTEGSHVATVAQEVLLRRTAR
jgi:acyl-CoA thioesterase-2